MGLFADYVNTWLKIKQELAGWPDDCRTPEEKQSYLRRYQERDGITLENVAKKYQTHTQWWRRSDPSKEGKSESGWL